MAYKKTGPGKVAFGSVPNTFKLSNFDVEGATLKIEHETFLLAQVLPLLQNGVLVRLMGLTDRTGSDDYNSQLADRRIDAVRDFLTRNAPPGSFRIARARIKGEQGAALMGLPNDKADAAFRAVAIQVGGSVPKPEPVKPKPRMDFIIRFIGNGTDGLLTPDQVISSDSIKQAATYQGLLNGGRRAISRLGHLTADADRKAKRDSIRESVLAAKRAEALGLVIVLGSSSGGNNAISMVKELTGDGVTVQLLAVADPALFPDGARPRFLPDNQGLMTPLPIPSFNVGKVDAGRKLNFYQVRGNWIKFSIRQQRSVYTSNMINEEIHGKLDGFEDTNLTGSCLKADHDDVHVEAVNLSVPPIRTAVIETLEQAESLVPSALR